MTDDKPDDPVSLEERRSKRAQDKIMEGLKPAQTLAQQMWDDRKKRMDYLGEWFGLDEPYNYKVLSMLLFASEEWEEPPFKPFTDIGWLWRAYCLAYDVASRIRGSIGHPNNPRYPDWTKEAKAAADTAEDWNRLTERAYESLPSLLSVPVLEHAELHEIVNGLSQFSDRRNAGRSHRYVCLVQAIIEACEGAARTEVVN
jgi:hypothetical protein